MSEKILVRMATLEDAPRLLEIYAPYVEKTAISFEYDVPNLEEFTQRIKSTLERYPYVVAHVDGKIVGYAYASAFHPRRAYIWSAESSIYVDMNCRKSGCGRALYEALESILKKQNVLNINACIAYTDSSDEHLDNNSMEFHQHMGYTLVGRFDNSGYKFDTWYHMIWMQKMIGQHSKNPAQFIPLPELIKSKGDIL